MRSRSLIVNQNLFVMRSHFGLSRQSHLEFVGSVGSVSARPGLRHYEVSNPENRLTQVS
jgi:hypothetical protein